MENTIENSEILRDCSEILYNVCDTNSEAKTYIMELRGLIEEGRSEQYVYSWLKQTTDSIYVANK